MECDPVTTTIDVESVDTMAFIGIPLQSHLRYMQRNASRGEYVSLFTAQTRHYTRTWAQIQQTQSAAFIAVGNVIGSRATACRPWGPEGVHGEKRYISFTKCGTHAVGINMSSVLSAGAG